MREFHPGLHAFLELHVDDVEAFLAENFEPVGSEEVRSAIGARLLRRSDRPSGKVRPISIAGITPLGSA